MFRSISAIVAIVLFLSTASVSFAQSEDEIISTVSTGGANQSSPLQCFDYYDFNSLAVDVTSAVEITTAGTPMSFFGSVTNENDHQLTDVTLLVKVFRVNEALVQAGNGNELVDYYTLEKGLTFRPGETKDLAFEWEVPEAARDGDYFLTVYALENEFALTGLAFSDDVFINSVDFTVTEGQDTAAYLDKNATTINGEVYKFTALPQTFDTSEGPVVIETEVVNPTDEVQRVPLQWNQYSFDASREQNIQNTQTELLTLEPGETRTVSYEVTPTTDAAVFVTARTKVFGVESVLHMRYVQEGYVDARFAYAGMSSYPLKEGDSVTVYACAHSTGEDIEAKVNITVSDLVSGDVLHQYSYAGVLTGEVGGYGEAFVPEADYDKVKVTVSLEQDGEVTEERTVLYDCSLIAGVACSDEAEANGSFFENLINNPVWFFGGVFVLLCLLYLVWSVHRRHHRGPDINAMDMKTSLRALFFLLLIPTLFFASADNVAAKTKAVTGSVSNTFNDDGIQIRYEADYTIKYHAQLRNLDTGEYLNNGATVPAGTKVQIIPKDRSSNVLTSDVHYNFTGEVMGTPNGIWGELHVSNCNQDYAIGGGANTMQRNVSYYSPFSVQKKAETITMPGATPVANQPGVYILDNNGSYTATVTYPEAEARWNIEGRYPYDDPEARPPTYCSGTRTVSKTIGETTINFTVTAVGGNTPPEPPEIDGPTTGQTGTDYGFSLTASDPDGDQIRYGITDQSCSTVTQWLPSGNNWVASGQSRNLNKNWSSEGSYTIYALTEDKNGGRSSCASHTIAISEAPAVPVTVDLKVNGSDGPLDVYEDDSVQVSWSHENAGSCEVWGPGLPFGGLDNVSANGSYTVPAGSLSPGQGMYMLLCDNGDDSVDMQILQSPSATPDASLEVSVNNGNWNTSNVTVGAEDSLRFRWSSSDAASCSATSGAGFGTGGNTSGTDSSITTPDAGDNDTYTVNCDGSTDSITVTAELADLSIAAWAVTVDDDSFNPDTMAYDNGMVRFTHSNVTSRSAVPQTTATLQYGGGITRNAPGLAGGEEYVGQVSIPVTNLPLGDFRANLTVNQPQSVTEKTRANNSATVTYAVPAPNPGLFINADRIQVRPNDTVVLTWGATNPYPMNCRVRGSGVDITRNNAVPSGTTAPNNNPAITAKSEYTLTCTEPITSTTFSASVTVETVGTVEEV